MARPAHGGTLRSMPHLRPPRMRRSRSPSRPGPGRPSPAAPPTGSRLLRSMSSPARAGPALESALEAKPGITITPTWVDRALSARFFIALSVHVLASAAGGSFSPSCNGMGSRGKMRQAMSECWIEDRAEQPATENLGQLNQHHHSCGTPPSAPTQPVVGSGPFASASGGTSGRQTQRGPQASRKHESFRHPADLDPTARPP